MEAPPTVACEFLRQTTTGRILIHLVNYDPLNEARDVHIRVAPQIAGPNPSAAFVSPDPGAAPAVIDTTEHGMAITISALEAYGIVMVEL